MIDKAPPETTPVLTTLRSMDPPPTSGSNGMFMLAVARPPSRNSRYLNRLSVEFGVPFANLLGKTDDSFLGSGHRVTPVLVVRTLKRILI